VTSLALFTEDQTLEFFGAHQRARHGRGHAQLDQKVDEYQPRFQHRMNLLVESQAPPPGRRTAAPDAVPPPNDFLPEKWCAVRDQLPIVPAASRKSCSTLALQPAGTPP